MRICGTRSPGPETCRRVPIPDQNVAGSFTTFDGLTVNVGLFDKDDTHWIALSASGSGAAEAEAKAIGDKTSR